MSKIRAFFQRLGQLGMLPEGGGLDASRRSHMRELGAQWPRWPSREHWESRENFARNQNLSRLDNRFHLRIELQSMIP